MSFGGQAKQVTGTGAPRHVTFQLPAGVCDPHVPPRDAGRLDDRAPPDRHPDRHSDPAPVPQVGALETKRVVKVSRNRFAVSVACEGDRACAGTLKVRTARKVEMRSGKRVVTVAEARATRWLRARRSGSWSS